MLKAEMRGVRDGVRKVKVGNNPYRESDTRHWAWMKGWIKSNSNKKRA